MATKVIIPARNEEKTIGPIVGAFSMHPDEFEVYVGIDADTDDKTAQVALDWGGISVPFTTIRGKGQVVRTTLETLDKAGFLEANERVILCDGDYTGLTFDHVVLITRETEGMILGVPDWPDIDVPNHVINAWPQVTGFRCLPWQLVPPNAHGYLLESQLNLKAVNSRLPIRQIFMTGLKAPFQWPLSPKRMAELQRDRKWGLENGVL